MACCHPPHWAGPSKHGVTGETGGGVASPQKSRELNKPPSAHTGISFHSAQAYRQLQKKFFFHPTKKEEEVVAQSCSGSVQIFLSNPLTWLDYFFYSFSSIKLSFSRLLSCRCSVCANVFTLCFTAHLSPLMALWSLHPSIWQYLCSALLLSSHLLLVLVVMPTGCLVKLFGFKIFLMNQSEGKRHFWTFLLSVGSKEGASSNLVSLSPTANGLHLLGR